MTSRPKDDEHLVAFHPWSRFDLADIKQIVFEFLQNLRAQLAVGHLSPTKPNGGLDLVTIL